MERIMQAQPHRHSSVTTSVVALILISPEDTAFISRKVVGAPIAVHGSRLNPRCGDVASGKGGSSMADRALWTPEVSGNCRF